MLCQIILAVPATEQIHYRSIQFSLSLFDVLTSRYAGQTADVTRHEKIVDDNLSAYKNSREPLTSRAYFGGVRIRGTQLKNQEQIMAKKPTTGRGNAFVCIDFSRATILAAAIEPRVTSSDPVYCAENFAHLSLWSCLEEVQLLTCGARCRLLR